MKEKTIKNEQAACFSLHWDTESQAYLETKYRKSISLLLIIWWQHCQSNVTSTTLRHEQLLRSYISHVEARKSLDFCIYVHIPRAVFEGFVWSGYFDVRYMSLATYVVIRTVNVGYRFLCLSDSIDKTHYVVFFTSMCEDVKIVCSHTMRYIHLWPYWLWWKVRIQELFLLDMCFSDWHSAPQIICAMTRRSWCVHIFNAAITFVCSIVNFTVDATQFHSKCVLFC